MRQPNALAQDVHNGGEAPSLAWLLVSGAGAALAALAVAGIVVGRAGLPVTGKLLLAAALAGALPQVWAIARGRWAVRWPELIATGIAFSATAALGLALAWPALLPLGLSVDAVHHTQLVNWIAERGTLPQPGRDIQGLLGEMVAYPVGMALAVVAAARLTGQPPVAALYPTAALVGALIVALVVLLSSAAARADRGAKRNTRHATRDAGRATGSPITYLFALLVGPLLLLAHRTYLLEAYIDHSYYTMVLGVLLVLLAGAWLIVAPRLSWGAAAQFGLVLAALMGVYPLWAPIPAALAIAAILTSNVAGPGTNDQRPTMGGRAFVFGRWALAADRRFSISRMVSLLALALGPALALALLDVLPRLRVGQAVLAHEGLVTLPSLQRLMPLVLALPLAPLLLRAERAIRLLALAVLAALVQLALYLLAQLGLAADYHSYKVLFVLTPLAAAVAGAGALRLTRSIDAWAAQKEASRRERPGGQAGVLLFASFAPFAANLGPRSIGLGGMALALALSGSFRVIPPPAIQVLSPDVVAAALWLRATSPKDAERAIVVGAPAGPLAYWVRVGLLGQRRDQLSALEGAITAPPPSPESWLVDAKLAPVAIVPRLADVLPGMVVAARFGDALVVRRAAQIDPAPLNPLTIRYRTFWEDERLKTAIELQRPVAGQLPLIELRLYHGGARLAAFALPPEQNRTRPQYLGADLLPATLGGEGYINQSAYPTFTAPAVAPSGALTLTLALSLGGNTVDERQLATFNRTPGGQLADLSASGGELIYLRRGGDALADVEGQGALDFGGALRLTGWQVPERAAAREPLAIDLRWQAPRALDRSLFPEVLLRDAGGKLVASSLEAPQGGFYPTWRWRPGEEVPDRRALALPPDLPAGSYHVLLRVHDFAAQHTLVSSAGARADGLVELGVVRIER
jgi:hypothetical protein